MARTFGSLLGMVLLLVAANAVASAQEPAEASQAQLESTGALPQRVEVSEAGIATTFPADWYVDVLMQYGDITLPPDVRVDRPAGVWTVLLANGPGEAACELGLYDDHPLTLADHARWMETDYAQDPKTSATQMDEVDLPIGLAHHLDLQFGAEFTGSIYLFEAEGRRYQLRCGDEVAPDDAWRSVADTLEPIPWTGVQLAESGLAALPDGAGIALDFSTTVSVVNPATPDFPVGSLMQADCAYALWIPKEDGSATEWSACTLIDEPVDPAEYQGQRPTEPVSDAGGPCLWASDYWTQTSRAQVVADSFSVVVTPDGQIFSRSTYPAEPLSCEG